MVRPRPTNTRIIAKHDNHFMSALREGFISVDLKTGAIWRFKRAKRSGEFVHYVPPQRAEYLSNFGYFMVAFRRKALGAHRVVWMAAHGSIQPNLEINHKNGDPTDNRLENLELVDHSANQFHSFRVLGRIKVGTRKLTRDQVEIIRLPGNKRKSHQLAREFGVHVATIYSARNSATY